MLERWKQRREKWGGDVLAVYMAIRNQCPGAAYIFAAQVVEAYAVIDKESRVRFLTLANEEKYNLFALHSWPDFGMNLLALRFMTSVAKSNPLGYLDMAAMTIREFGLKYRELRPADFIPPVNHRLVKTLQGKYRSVGEMILAIKRDHSGLGTPETIALGEQNTVLALTDIVYEVEKGVLPRYVSELDRIIPDWRK
jgi:hypothetical protein